MKVQETTIEAERPLLRKLGTIIATGATALALAKCGYSTMEITDEDYSVPVSARLTSEGIRTRPFDLEIQLTGCDGTLSRGVGLREVHARALFRVASETQQTSLQDVELDGIVCDEASFPMPGTINSTLIDSRAYDVPEVFFIMPKTHQLTREDGTFADYSMSTQDLSLSLFRGADEVEDIPETPYGGNISVDSAASTLSISFQTIEIRP